MGENKENKNMNTKEKEPITGKAIGNYLARVLVSVIGLFLLAVGVNFSVKASLGISPTSVIPFVASQILPVSMGKMTMALNFSFILIQIILMRKKTNWVSCGYQVAVALVFGYFVDFAGIILTALTPANYIFKAIFTIIGIILISAGTFLGVKSNLIMPSGEALTIVLSQKLKTDFGKVKIALDAVQVIIAIAFSLIFLRSLAGVREGTIAAVLLVGIIVRWMSKHIKVFDKVFAKKGAISTEDLVEVATADAGICITIGREFGSGGREIGMQVAEKLGYRFIDREILALSVLESGFDEEYVEKYEESNRNARRFEIYESMFHYVDTEIPKQRQLFIVQSNIIRHLAAEGNCVIVGRLANYILRDMDNTLDVFVSADKEFRVNRVMTEGNHTREYAERRIAQRDSERQNHCRLCTGRDWGRAEDYALTVRSSRLGIDASVEAICKFATAMEMERKAGKTA